MSDALPGDEDYVPPKPQPFVFEDGYLVGALYRTDEGGRYVRFIYPGDTPMSLESAKLTAETLNNQDVVSQFGVDSTETSDFYKVFSVPSVIEYTET